MHLVPSRGHSSGRSRRSSTRVLHPSTSASGACRSPARERMRRTAGRRRARDRATLRRRERLGRPRRRPPARRLPLRRRRSARAALPAGGGRRPPRRLGNRRHRGQGRRAADRLPYMSDQFTWHSQVVRLGLGPRAGLLRMLSARSLSKAVRECLGNERYRRKAEEIATAIRATDGVALTVRAIEAIRSDVEPFHPRRFAMPHPYQDPGRPVEERVNDLLARMTLEEKIGADARALADPLRGRRAPPAPGRLHRGHGPGGREEGAAATAWGRSPARWAATASTRAPASAPSTACRSSCARRPGSGSRRCRTRSAWSA